MNRLFLSLAAMAMLASCGTKSSGDAANVADGNAAADTTVTAPVITPVAGDVSADPTMPVIVDFNADWCGPCRMFAPVFEAVASRYEGKARFVSVNVDRNEELAERFGVSAIPQITIIYSDGATDSAAGFMEQPEFDTFVAKAISDNASHTAR